MPVVTRSKGFKTVDSETEKPEKKVSAPAKKRKNPPKEPQKDDENAPKEKQSKKSEKKPPPKATDTEQAVSDTATVEDTPQNIYQFTANDIKGNQVSLDKYKGHVCIIVNVASRCGHTKAHYEQLVELFEKHSEPQGLRILAFPCNQFGNQEPQDNDKISEFASKRNVTFDMFEKICVKGKNAHPLYEFLTSRIKGKKGNAIAWNFTKFIIDKEGNVVGRYEAAAKPLSLLGELEKYW
ncbi:unnamed protein product [Phyllotreta striolata]|uniref:Glutathione peroxidase n=1 Tax=Phyllotreta striolata TaxID=444603 RepID=A0A9N9TQ73_PHYSR|nr:unnamed protein product [Phyllotreta striolata]